MNFDTIIFAGGGSRCAWQIGMLEVLARQRMPDPKFVGAVSAGALMASLYYSGTHGPALEYFLEETGRNEKNAYFENIFSNKPVFPQYVMYKRLLEKFLDETALKRLKEGPEMKFLISHPPGWLGAIPGTIAGLATYSLEKAIRHPVHPVWTRKLGYSPLILKVQEMKTPEELHRAILMSSCTPPFVPVLYHQGRPVLDGGLVDNVPVLLAPPESGEILVLLTRSYKNLPKIEGRTYLAPIEPITIDKWDYSSPEGLREALEQGRREGEILLQGVRP